MAAIRLPNSSASQSVRHCRSYRLYATVISGGQVGIPEHHETLQAVMAYDLRVGPQTRQQHHRERNSNRRKMWSHVIRTRIK